MVIKMTEKKKPNPYDKCKLFVENESCCGPFKDWDKDGMFVIDELNADISNHLNSLKVNVLTSDIFEEFIAIHSDLIHNRKKR